MRPNAAVTMLCITLVCAFAVYAQDDTLYSKIQPLETAVTNGSATHDQQIELARLYIQSGRFYEASKVANRLLVMDANDAAAASIKSDADKAMRDAAQKSVAAAEARANAAGATDQDRLALA